MGLFSSDKLFTEKEMHWENFKYSKVMKGLLKNPKISKELNSKLEQKQFYEALKKKAPGGVTRNEMREILYELRYENKGGGIDTISAEEARHVAEAIFPGEFTERYRRPERPAHRSDPKDLSRPSRFRGTISSEKGSASRSPSPSRPSAPSPKSFPTRPRF